MYMNTKIKVLILFLCLIAPVSYVVPKTVVHPWKNKKVAFFGDSITDPNIKTKGTDSKGRTNMHYWDYLHEWLGITPYVYAISGRQWNDIPRQTDRLNKEHGGDVDAITIFMGTNDFITDIPLGEWFTVKEDSVVVALSRPKAKVARMHRELNMDNKTLRGRINIAMDKLKSVYPDKQIVILTPIHRAFATFSEKNIQPDETYANRLGLYVEDYVKAIRETADVWSVPVIDLYSLSGLYPMKQEHYRYFNKPDTDRLHPNTPGHERIAKTLYYQFLTLPCELK